MIERLQGPRRRGKHGGREASPGDCRCRARRQAQGQGGIRRRQSQSRHAVRRRARCREE